MAELSKALDSLSLERQELEHKQDAASRDRFAEIEATSRSYERSISEKLSSIANDSVGTIPVLDPDDVDALKGEYLFYKPILYRHGQDRLYYRGMVRLEIDARPVLAEARQAQADFIRIASIIAGIVLCAGVVGAFLLSAWFTAPPDAGG